MSFLVRGAAAGIGYASESIHKRKEKKNRRNADGDIIEDDASSAASSTENHPAPESNALDLDEAQEEVNKPKLDPKKIGVADCSKLAQQFAAAHANRSKQSSSRQITAGPYEPLNSVIVLPQRRPSTRARGFIQAYAPILETRGIDQESFLEFVEMFNYALQAATWLDAINLAALATIGMEPTIGLAVSIALRVAVDTGKEMASRHRTNEFLDRINQYYFRPRGLYCMVMTWKPHTSSFSTTVDINEAAEKHSEKTEGGSRSFGGRFATSSGSSYGNLQFPECAPLIFPRLDDMSQSDAKKKKKTGGFSTSVTDYKDRRARAQYAMKNPDSQLAQMGQRPQFSSRYADPSHPAARGNLVGLLTGGSLTIGEGLSTRMTSGLDGGTGSLLTGTSMLTGGSGSRRILGGVVGGTLVEKKKQEEGLDEKDGKYYGQYSGTYQEMKDASSSPNALADPVTAALLGSLHPGNLLKMMTGRQTLYLAVVDLPSKETMKQATSFLARADPARAQTYQDLDIDSIVDQYQDQDWEQEHQDPYSERTDAPFQETYGREFEEAYGYMPPPLASTSPPNPGQQ